MYLYGEINEVRIPAEGKKRGGKTSDEDTHHSGTMKVGSDDGSSPLSNPSHVDESAENEESLAEGQEEEVEEEDEDWEENSEEDGEDEDEDEEEEDEDEDDENDGDDEVDEGMEDDD